MCLQKRNPGEVLDERVENVPLAETILEKREADVARAWEHNHAGEPNLETVEVEAIDGETPPEKEVIKGRQDGSAGKTICRNG